MASQVRLVTREETSALAQPLEQPDGSPAGELAVVSDPANGAPVWGGVWSCKPATWASPFDVDETFHVTAGHLRIVADGETYELTPGVTAFFPKGLQAEWTVLERVEAFVVIA